ncbi:MAG: hypothetical protein HY275_00035 [Gemmatimonadetes bacterium]|nr:hypothetical protein [Gemmatimonadota bacterium]
MAGGPSAGEIEVALNIDACNGFRACTTDNNVGIDPSYSALGMATAIVHEVTHVFLQAMGVRKSLQDVAAWNRGLNLFQRGKDRVDDDLVDALRQRRASAWGFNRGVFKAACKLYGDCQ